MEFNLYQQTRKRRGEFRIRHALEGKLDYIDGLAFGAYRELLGGWKFEHFDLFINHVPRDHHGPPTHWVIWIDPEGIGLPENIRDSREKRVAAADFFLRCFLANLGEQLPGSRGSGIGGMMETDRPGQSIQERNTCFFDGDAIELRLLVGMPSAGMILLIDELRLMFELLERTVEETFLPRQEMLAELDHHLRIAAVQDRLREEIVRRGLVAFISGEALLARAGGNSDEPLKTEHVRSFECPSSLEVEIDLGDDGKYRGLGIPRGVSVITGGPYHGKSTLLSAIEEGTKNHVPGDGRELVVSNRMTFRTEAEEGRQVFEVDLSPFLHDLPSHVDVCRFSSGFASGSTSQAANIVEAIHAGAKVLLIDEDRAATNLMFADEGMRALMKADDLTVTSFLERARELYEVCGISSVIVAGSSSRYFAVADTVIKMEEYVCRDITEAARAIAVEYHSEVPSPPAPLKLAERIPLQPEVDLYRGRRFVECRCDRRGVLVLENFEIDLGRLPGMAPESQLIATGLALAYSLKYLVDGKSSIAQIMTRLEQLLDKDGLVLLDPFRQHFVTRPDRFQVSAALNRFGEVKYR